MGKAKTKKLIFFFSLFFSHWLRNSYCLTEINQGGQLAGGHHPLDIDHHPSGQ